MATRECQFSQAIEVEVDVPERLAAQDWSLAAFNNSSDRADLDMNALE
jgi:hypothetical protein